MSAKLTPAEVAQLHLDELEQLAYPVLANDAGRGQDVLKALRRCREQLGLELAGARWRYPAPVEELPDDEDQR